MNVNEVDKQKVVEFMMKYRCGHFNASPRHEIIKYLNMDDRYFREVCSLIPEIITSAEHGYYILPLTDPTGEETRFARQIVEGEERRRMIALYLRQRKQRQAIKRMEAAERQLEFTGVK